MGRRTDNKDKKRKWGRLGRDPGIVFSCHEAILWGTNRLVKIALHAVLPVDRLFRLLQDT